MCNRLIKHSVALCPVALPRRALFLRARARSVRPSHSRFAGASKARKHIRACIHDFKLGHMLSNSGAKSGGRVWILHTIYINSGGCPSNSGAKSGARLAKSGGRLFQHKKLGRPSLRPSLKGTRPSLYKLYGESKLGRPSLRPSLENRKSAARFCARVCFGL